MSANGAKNTADLTADGSVLESVSQFTTAIREGADWFDALLSAIAIWPVGQETHEGRHYQYLVGGEAFDWLLLAERLTLCADGLVPEESRDRLLFHGIPPRTLSEEEFKEKIGPAKYRAMSNYWYGVTVEEALALVADHEVRKQRRGLGPEEPGLDDAVYQRIYGQPRWKLLQEFWTEREEPEKESSSLADLKEFTYWLFKYRMKRSDPARLASDTKKGLDFLQSLGRRLPSG